MSVLMKKMRSLSLTFLSLLLLSPAGWADNPSVNERPKMQSMGGTGAAIRGDKDSALMNPAGLADIEDPEWQIFPLIMEFPFELDVLSSALDFNDVRERDSATTAEKRAALDEFLRDAGSTSAKTRVNLYPSYTRKIMGVGMHVGIMVEALVDSRFSLNALGADRIANTEGTSNTVGLILGAGYGFLENSLQVGATIKPLYRNSIFPDRNVTVLEVATAQNEGVSSKDQILGGDPGGRSAFGVGFDLGVKYWLQSYGVSGLDGFIELMKPSVGLTYQDIGNTRFFSDDAQPQDIEQSVSGGIAFHPELAFTKNTIALDMRNIQEKQEIFNKLHFGAESVLWNFWAIRFGVGQGYVSGGMGLDIPFFELDLYVAAQEAGKRIRLQEERVIGIRLSATL